MLEVINIMLIVLLHQSFLNKNNYEALERKKYEHTYYFKKLYIYTIIIIIILFLTSLLQD